MGDRHSDGGSRVPARDGSASSADGLRLALSRALRAEVLDAPAEQRVLAAFRAARDSGSHQRADTRKRDDWRPRPRPARRSLRAAVGVLVSGLVLSGVAVAAIGTPGKGHDQRQDDDGRAPRRPSASAPAAPASSAPTPYDTASPASPVPPAGPSAAPTPDRPPTAEDIQVHCRAYPSARGSGKALESAAWQRFLAAAGGEDNVAAHCADHLRQAPPGNPGKAQDGSQGDTPRPTAEQGRPSQAAEKSKGPPAQQE